MSPAHKKLTHFEKVLQLEGITGIYEQLAPLQFHFIEKPAQILQIPSLNLNFENIDCFEFTQPL